VDASATDPCWLSVKNRKDEEQLWFCHGDCFKRALYQGADFRAIFEPQFF